MYRQRNAHNHCIYIYASCSVPPFCVRNNQALTKPEKQINAGIVVKGVSKFRWLRQMCSVSQVGNTCLPLSFNCKSIVDGSVNARPRTVYCCLSKICDHRTCCVRAWRNFSPRRVLRSPSQAPHLNASVVAVGCVRSHLHRFQQLPDCSRSNNATVFSAVRKKATIYRCTENVQQVLGTLFQPRHAHHSDRPTHFQPGTSRIILWQPMDKQCAYGVAPCPGRSKPRIDPRKCLPLARNHNCM